MLVLPSVLLVMSALSVVGATALRLAPVRSEVATPSRPTALLPHGPRRSGRPLQRVQVETLCRVCGWPLDGAGWVDGVPMFTVCDCCACETGVDDATPDRTLAHRRRWVATGGEWFDVTRRPEDWDLYAHLCQRVPIAA